MSDAADVAVPSDRSDVDRLAPFAALWALASLWHLLGNTLTSPAWAQALLVVAVVLVLHRPTSPTRLALHGFAGLVMVWEEAPVLGNHWLLAGFVNLCLVIACCTTRSPAAAARRFVPAARTSLLTFYAFAAFAKLNSAFFDRSVSCAVHYFRVAVDELGLGALRLDGAAGPEWAVIAVTAVVELSVVPLLLGRRTRAVGVALALTFHGALALDPAHPFYAFSAVLAPLFLLFLPESALRQVLAHAAELAERIGVRSPAAWRGAHLAGVTAAGVLGLMVVGRVLSPDGLRWLGWWTWQVASLLVVVLVVVVVGSHRAVGRADVRLRPAALLAVVPVLVAVNGLSPYLELKTGYSWNMYSNLQTVDGESNHLLVRRTLPLTDEQGSLVRIVRSSDPELSWYADAGYALTWRQLRTYLAAHPDASLTYERDGVERSADPASSVPELVDAPPTWQQKLQLFRAVDLSSPQRCLTVVAGTQ